MPDAVDWIEILSGPHVPTICCQYLHMNTHHKGRERGGEKKIATAETQCACLYTAFHD